MKLLFSPPTLEDFTRLLKAWRFWSVGALIGGLIGAAVYSVVPPPYRAHAVALVDFNLERALPEETDREHFYYLEREARKLEQIAFSDEVMDVIRESGTEMSTAEFHLSQPAEGGWNFYVDDTDPQRAATFANMWVKTFADTVQAKQVVADGPNTFIEVSIVRNAPIPFERSVSRSIYLFNGAVGFLVIGSLYALFASKQE